VSGGGGRGERKTTSLLSQHPLPRHAISHSLTFLPMKVFMSGELPFLVKATGKRVR